MRTRLSDEKSLIHLVVIFNLIGFNKEPGFKVCVKLEQVAKLLQEKFQKTFDISHVIEMDCSKSQSDCMKDCREKMKRIREEVLKVNSGEVTLFTRVISVRRRRMVFPNCATLLKSIFLFPT